MGRFLVRKVGDRDEWVIGAGAGEEDGSLEQGRVGHIGYGVQEVIDRSSDHRVAHDGFPPRCWWTPRFLVLVRQGMAEWHGAEADVPDANGLMERLCDPRPSNGPQPFAQWTSCTDRAAYLDRVRGLLAHIQRGDIYEVNYCTERRAVLPQWDPYAAFAQLVERTGAPFAALYRFGDYFALCASPERYLRIEPASTHGGNRRAILQPMKGTRRRATDPAADQALAEALASDKKERSENIMAVDVARHDLSRIAVSRSVRMEELCVVRSHAHVHQLVSTVAADLAPDRDLWDVVRATFPTASMTGAPKRRAMDLIAQAEAGARGLFSGALGFQLPDGTVDLNVVIRTITFHAGTGEASLMTGSAITAQSDPQQEWEECELKARSVLNAIGHAG